ncbi:hypothetical protein MTX78_25230 (plasmid) [Hymenobacter tibetensis]|uniref:Uncharacterized protein n=1 Tax=Hymenobacter tibetensis TaxID=497967 RepID=A0ABY4D6M6_9BACT|nr:hypothetical protein [Hymenobacter tibetensis]UOG77679.1 hypothetical protein MTX78_25230 [Hymenobacter tibetensis]
MQYLRDVLVSKQIIVGNADLFQGGSIIVMLSSLILVLPFTEAVNEAELYRSSVLQPPRGKALERNRLVSHLKADDKRVGVQLGQQKGIPVHRRQDRFLAVLV